MSKGVKLKDIDVAMSLYSQPVCLSIASDTSDVDERLYYNMECDFVGSTRCNDFEGLIKEYGDYWVWDISLFQNDWGDPYIEVSAVKRKPK